jgi:hypothetical protein
MRQSSRFKNSASSDRNRVGADAKRGARRHWDRAAALGLFSIVLMLVGALLMPSALAADASTPSVSGDTQVGSTLTLAVTPAATGEVWFECLEGLPVLCAPTSDTTDSYLLTDNDLGDTLYVVETESDGTTVNSNVVGPVTPATTTTTTTTTTATTTPPTTTTTPPTTTTTPTPPTPKPKDSSAPSISGTTQLGQTLTADVGTASPSATGYDYQWLRCALNCTAIPGAVGATYQLGDSDVGDAIAVTVTGTTAATSARTGTVTAPSTLQIVASPSQPLVNQSVTIVGVVTSTAAGTDPSGTVAFADDGSVISGCAAVSVPATGQTVTVSCATSFPVSSPSLSASFSPAASSPLLGSSASTMALSVGRGYSTTSLDVPAKALRGAMTTYTASIAAGRNLIGPVLPGGTVSFLDHGKAIAGCETARIKDGGATCTVRNAQTGTQTISARYGGDANFRGSSSTIKAVQVSAAPSKRAKVLGSVTATMQWTFHYHPSFTQITALVLHGANTGGMVTIHCTGRGCPFASRAHAVVKRKRCRSTKKHTCPAPGTIDLEPSFRHHRLRVHAQVTITVTHARYVGKYYRFTIRARRQPSVKISCLAVGSSKPGVGCAAP